MIVEPLLCARTGNPCGTDTWAAGSACDCSCCSRWLAAFREGVEAAAREIERKNNRSPSRQVRRETAEAVRALAGDDPLCAICRRRMSGADLGRDCGAIAREDARGLVMRYENERNESLAYEVQPAPQKEISMPFAPGAPICGACVRGYGAVGMLVHVSGPRE